MSTIEIVAKHAIVSDTCRANRTTEGAIDEALERLRDEAVALMARRGEGRGDLFHFKLSIERVTGSAGNAGVQASTAPSMPDDYWLHVRGCDCAFCAWERANGGDPLTRAAEEWAANSTKCCAGKRGPYVKQKCVTCPFGSQP